MPAAPAGWRWWRSSGAIFARTAARWPGSPSSSPSVSSPSLPIRRPARADGAVSRRLLQPPVWEVGGDWRFILGTDPVGRDMLSRLIHGSRYSLFIGLVVVSLSLVVGI
jgi:ABC-type dipeptide/oligopeptide/nickel transport system permease subunit